MFYFSRFYILFIAIFNLSLLQLAKADEAAALCAFIAATNINSLRNDWRCDNTGNRCSWPGINCHYGLKVYNIDLNGAGITGRYIYIYIYIYIKIFFDIFWKMYIQNNKIISSY